MMMIKIKSAVKLFVDFMAVCFAVIAIAVVAILIVFSVCTIIYAMAW